MNHRTSSAHYHYLLAAAFCLSITAAGCASSGDTTMPDKSEQGMSSKDYDSTDGDTGSADKSQSGPTNSNAGEMQSSEDAAPVSDAELRQFAAINREMKKIQTEARKKLQAAESEEEANKVQRKTQKKVQSVFKDKEMSRERYTAIGKKLRSDPELQKRYREQMRGQSR